MIPFLRIVRDLKAVSMYPLWVAQQKAAPDNHLHKVNRLKKIGKRYKCQTVIETGTFYGQTVNALRNTFDKVMSVEVYAPLYEYNEKQFSGIDNVKIFFGSSSQHLKDMLAQAEGKVLYWLDGHYSGQGTGMDAIECPIIEELTLIRSSNRTDDCILIDDKRLFGRDKDYPSLEQVRSLLLSINPNYIISFELDCIMALPPVK